MDIATFSVQPKMSHQHPKLLQMETKQAEISSGFVEKEIQSDKITISPEARTKVAEGSISEKNRSALHELATRGQEENAVDKDSQIDSMIKKLKEKISALMQQISRLKAKGDTNSLEQQKALEVQLAALNSQLMELTSRKLEMLEQGVE